MHDVLTLTDAAKVHGCSRGTVRNALDAGVLRGLRRNGRWLAVLADDRWEQFKVPLSGLAHVGLLDTEGILSLREAAKHKGVCPTTIWRAASQCLIDAVRTTNGRIVAIRDNEMFRAWQPAPGLAKTREAIRWRI